MKNYRPLVILIILALFPLTVHAAAEAGKFLFVFGKVELELADGSKQSAKKGLSLYEGTTIRSDKSGKAQVKLVDGGFFAVRPNTHLKIDEYAFNQKGRTNKGVVSLLKGTFRTISGAIAKENSNNVMVKTPIATIGIRGTDHEPAFIPANDPSFSPDLQPGVYDKVNSGSTVIKNEVGEMVIGPNQVGFVARPDQNPVMLQQIPAFFQKPNVAVNTDSETGEDTADSEQQADSQDSGEESPTESEDQQQAPDANEPVAEDAGTVTDTAPAIEETLEVTDASGNTINLDNQTVTSTDGTVTQIQPSTTGGSAVSAHVAILSYKSSAPAFKIIEETEFIDGVRETILRDATGHVYGGNDEFGDARVYGINEASKVYKQAGDFSNNGIEFGMYTADYFTDHEGSFDLGNRYLGWITGPVYQSTNLTGFTTFNFDGGLAYGGDLNGTWSKLDYNNATLTVDFLYNQSNLTLDVGPAEANQWVFTAAGLPLKTDGTGEFDFDSAGATLNMTHNGSNANVFYDVSGSLVGKDDGAAFSFAAKKIISGDTNGVGVSGVAAFDR